MANKMQIDILVIYLQHEEQNTGDKNLQAQNISQGLQQSTLLKLLTNGTKYKISFQITHIE